MTRDEAVKMIKALPSWKSYSAGDAEADVDSLVSLGLLKLDEPETADDVVRRLLLEHMEHDQVTSFCNELAHAGFQIRRSDAPVSHAEDLYRDALERLACAVEKRYIVMHTEAGEHTETVYGFIRRTLASVSK